MRKKLFKIVAGVLACGMALALGACDILNMFNKHEHAWSEDYVSAGESGHYQACTGCDEHSEMLAHTWGTTYTSDGKGGHYVTCTVCGEKSETSAHTWGTTYTSDGASGHHQTCTKCNETSTTVAHQEGKTYTSDGANGHHLTCSNCKEPSATVAHVWGTTYTSAGTDGHYLACTECKEHAATVAHVWGTTYTADGRNGHYLSCADCGANSETAEHTFIGDSLICEDCGYEEADYSLEIAIWGRFITEAHFSSIFEAFKTYAVGKGLDVSKIHYTYYDKSEYNGIAVFSQAILDNGGADIVFPCATNFFTNGGAITAGVNLTALGTDVNVDGKTDRAVAQLTDTEHAKAFYEFCLSEEGKAAINAACAA